MNQSAIVYVDNNWYKAKSSEVSVYCKPPTWDIDELLSPFSDKYFVGRATGAEIIGPWVRGRAQNNITATFL